MDIFHSWANIKLIRMDMCILNVNFKVHQSRSHSCAQHEGKFIKSFLCTFIPYNSYLFVPHFSLISLLWYVHYNREVFEFLMFVFLPEYLSSCMHAYIWKRDRNSLNRTSPPQYLRGGSNRIPLRDQMSSNRISNNFTLHARARALKKHIVIGYEKKFILKSHFEIKWKC